jgi:Uncharacterized protein conserved in bacteria (DUF2125)
LVKTNQIREHMEVVGNEFEGQRAIALTLHFNDGVAFLGPLKLGQVPPALLMRNSHRLS